MRSGTHFVGIFVIFPAGFESLGDHFIDLGADEGVVLQALCRKPLE